MKPSQEATETDYMRLAMMIDCEGHIAIDGSPRRSYALHVTVGNRDVRLLEWCTPRFGGAIWKNENNPLPGRPPGKRWRMENQDAADLLVKCLPHFIIKREQAEIAIRFRATY